MRDGCPLGLPLGDAGGVFGPSFLPPSCSSSATCLGKTGDGLGVAVPEVTAEVTKFQNPLLLRCLPTVGVLGRDPEEDPEDVSGPS